MNHFANKVRNSNRILIQGSSGAGKSTFARTLSQLLEIPVIHMDQHFWQEGWTRPDPKEWYEKQLSFYKQEKWIIEGGAYKKTLPQRAKASDLVIYLDFNRFFCFYRCIKRYFQYRGKTRPDLAEGCNEQVDYAFAKWILHEQPDIYGPRAIETIKENILHSNLMIISSPRQLKKLRKELICH